jgi:hypothetical protein
MVVNAYPAAYSQAGWSVRLSQIARERGAELLLLGAYGDDLFDGCPQTLADVARRGHWLRALWSAARLDAPHARASVRHVGPYVLRPLARELVPEPLRRFVQRRRLQRTQFQAWEGPRTREGRQRGRAWLARESQPIRPGHVLTNPFYRFFLLESAEVRLQCEASSDVAISIPLLDPDLVDFVHELPPELLMHGHRLRGLFRHAIKGLVPDKVRLRTDKADAIVAIRELIQGSLATSRLDELASMEQLGELGLVNAPAFREHFHGVLQEGAARTMDLAELWAPLALEAFVRTARARRWAA